MKIKKAKKVKKDKDLPDASPMIETEMDDGTVWFMPENPDTWHHELLQKFLADGGEIVEPSARG